MDIRSGRQVALLWAGALLVFVISAWASRALHSAVSSTRPTVSYYVGLLGLPAIGLDLLFTWRWTGRAGPAAHGRTVAARVLPVLGSLLWPAAMVFPFL